MKMTKALAIAALISVTAFAQQPPAAPGAARPAPKNLTVLAPDTDIRFVMQSFTQALGVQCTYCHVQGDFASDANPKKDIARKMIAMVRQSDTFFASSTGVYPAGYHEVDCGTCHRGTTKPEIKAPREHLNRAESLGRRAPPPTPGVNLKVLLPDTRVHGDGSVMHDFKDALTVDCGYCHGGGKGFQVDENPRKEIARKMITMVRQLNTNFPGTGVFPVGTQAVTCYTCHAGSPHPKAINNAHYDPPAAKQ